MMARRSFLLGFFLVVFFGELNLVWSNVEIRRLADQLSDDLQRIRNDELGVPFIMKLYGSFKYMLPNKDVMKPMRLMALKLEAKIEDVFLSLQEVRVALERAKGDRNLSFIPSSCVPSWQSFGHDQALYNNNFLQPLKLNLVQNAVKQQYYITDVDVKTLRRSPFLGFQGRDDRILWNNYMSRNNYIRKNVILLLDRSGSLSKRQFEILQSVAKELISVLDSHDRVALLSVANDWFALANSTDCLMPKQFPHINVLPSLKFAETIHKNTLYTFIDSLLRGIGTTNHTLGIQKAIETIYNERAKLVNETVMVVYLTQDVLSTFTETKDILKTLSDYTNLIEDTTIIINTCAALDEKKPSIKDRQFLTDLAKQNYEKFNVTYNASSRKAGIMLSLNSSDSVGFAVSRFYTPFNPSSSYETSRNISLPTWDPIRKDLTQSFTIAWTSNSIPSYFNMLGVDVFFENLAEDVAYYSTNEQYTYAFLVDLTGRVLLHPVLPRPSTVNQQLYFVDVLKIEHKVSAFKSALLNELEGQYVDVQEGVVKKRFAWKRVGSWYVICLVVNEEFGPPLRSFKAFYNPVINDKLLYQSLERSDNYKFCRHFNQLATLDASSLYLSMSCFQSPFSAANSRHDKLFLQSYIAYLKDDTRLLANPGLKDDVRDEVAALARVMDFLRKRHLSSLLSRFVVRRYIASRNGVLQVFPGSLLRSGLEATKRPWYTQAMNHKERVILTPPYLDGGGAGYIVTVAFELTQSVVAMDLTYGYMYKVLLGYMPECMQEKLTCFLMDDRGYLIYHPSLMDLSGTRPVGQQHIVHKESLVANDMLNHTQFIKKMLCNSYGDSTIQRYYKLNTNFNEVLVNKHCVPYHIAMVPNTNVFVGVINPSCSSGATFCPCSVINRLCLNCNRIEQKECECPCECPLNVDTEVCRNPNINITENEACTWFIEDQDNEEFFLGEDTKYLESCLPNDCSQEESFTDCLGLLGCEWCRYDSDGVYLRKPFCTSMSSCFNGYLGSLSPYKGESSQPVVLNDPDYSPIGPILGSLIAMCVLLVLLFICYRSYTSPTSERLYLSSTQDNQLRMSDINVNDHFHDVGNHRDKLLQDERPDPVSPYCVATTYRRNAAGADSDHGYSTMTPHDESEHLSLAPVDDDLTSDNASVQTSVSTKHDIATNTTPKGLTRLPRNCIVVPVTVHRNMELT